MVMLTESEKAAPAARRGKLLLCVVKVFMSIWTLWVRCM